MRDRQHEARNVLLDIDPASVTDAVSLVKFGFSHVRASSSFLKERGIATVYMNRKFELLAAALLHTQRMGLEARLDEAIRSADLGRRVILGSQISYDETSQRLTVHRNFATAKQLEHAKTDDVYVKNVVASILVILASMTFKTVPAPNEDGQNLPKE